MVRKIDPELRLRNSAFNEAVAAFVVTRVTLSSCPVSGSGTAPGLKRTGVIVRSVRIGAKPYAKTRFFGQMSPRRKTMRRGSCEISAPERLKPLYQATSCGPGAWYSCATHSAGLQESDVSDCDVAFTWTSAAALPAQPAWPDAPGTQPSCTVLDPPSTAAQ